MAGFPAALFKWCHVTQIHVSTCSWRGRPEPHLTSYVLPLKRVAPLPVSHQRLVRAAPLHVSMGGVTGAAPLYVSCLRRVAGAPPLYVSCLWGQLPGPLFSLCPVWGGFLGHSSLYVLILAKAVPFHMSCPRRWLSVLPLNHVTCPWGGSPFPLIVFAIHGQSCEGCLSSFCF